MTTQNPARLLVAAMTIGLAVLQECKAANFIVNPAEASVPMEARAKDILPWLLDQTPFVASPTGRQLIIKNDLGSADAELQLEDLETHQSLGRRAGGYHSVLGSAVRCFARNASARV